MDSTEHNGSPATLRSTFVLGVQPGLAGISNSQKRGHVSQGGRQRPKTKVTRACDLCKAKKAKCSGDQPCVSCCRKGLVCQYDAVYSRGKAPAPRQSRLASDRNPERPPAARSYPHSPDGITCAMPMFDIASDSREMQGASTIRLLQFTPQDEEPHEHVQELPSGRGSPGLEVAGQYSDPTSALSFLHRAWRRISNDENSQVVVGHSTEDDQRLPSAGDKPFRSSTQQVQLPSLSRAQKLLELYFDVCIATYRMLHRPTVEEWCVSILANVETNEPLPSVTGTAKSAVVLSVLAVAAFHEEKTRNGRSPTPELLRAAQSDAQADELFCEATRLSDAERGFPRLESAQSRLIQVLYLLMSSRFNQAWYTFGHALQIISALGLHRKDVRKHTPAIEGRDYIAEQCKKRTFWVAYTLDKYLGVIFGRPRHYHDDDIDQDLPDSINDEDMLKSGPQVGGIDDCHIDSLIHQAKLAQVAERISREVYSIKTVPDNIRLAASHRLGTELRQWKASLPPHLGAINPNSLIPTYRRQATALKLSYCHAVMLAHRPFLLKNTFRDDEGLRALAKETLAECISAAQSVLEAVDRMAPEGRLFHAFWWTHYVCFCALVIVYVWAIRELHDSPTINEHRRLLDLAERCLNHLAQATATNSPSRKYSIILQELRLEAKRKTARPFREPNATARIARADHAVNADTLEIGLSMADEHGRDIWQPLFGSPMDTTTSGLQNFLDDWQTTDWLHLDSSAFGPFSDSSNDSLDWI
jgi:hypothetical protein